MRFILVDKKSLIDNESDAKLMFFRRYVKVLTVNFEHLAEKH